MSLYRSSVPRKTKGSIDVEWRVESGEGSRKKMQLDCRKIICAVDVVNFPHFKPFDQFLWRASCMRLPVKERLRLPLRHATILYFSAWRVVPNYEDALSVPWLQLLTISTICEQSAGMAEAHVCTHASSSFPEYAFLGSSQMARFSKFEQIHMCRAGLYFYVALDKVARLPVLKCEKLKRYCISEIHRCREK